MDCFHPVMNWWPFRLFLIFFFFGWHCLLPSVTEGFKCFPYIYSFALKVFVIVPQYKCLQLELLGEESARFKCWGMLPESSPGRWGSCLLHQRGPSAAPAQRCLPASGRCRRWRPHTKLGISSSLAFLLIKFRVSLLTTCMLFFWNAISYFFIIFLPNWAMHGTKHIHETIKSCKVEKTLKNLEGFRTSIDAHNHYLSFLFLIFIFCKP